MDHLLQRIDEVIEQLGAEYREAPATVLTESDLQCLPVSRLLCLDELRGERPTLDANIRGAMVHSEVSWFDEEGRLRLKPDITILEPSNLSILRGLGGIRLPRKGFHFDGRAVIFELKFVRGWGGITARSVAAIRRDLEKIERLLNKLARSGARNELFCYFIVFSKVERRSPEFDELVARFAAEPRLKIVHKSAGLGRRMKTREHEELRVVLHSTDRRR